MVHRAVFAKELQVRRERKGKGRRIPTVSDTIRPCEEREKDSVCASGCVCEIDRESVCACSSE